MLGRSDALERIAACLQAIDDHEAEWRKVRQEFKASRERLDQELHTARADVNQMSLDEQFLDSVETRVAGAIWRGKVSGEERTIVVPDTEPEREWRTASEIEAGVPLWSGEEQ